jgi:hypothetical protein
MAKSPEQSWFKTAAQIIVREGRSLKDVSMEMNLQLTSAECEKIFRSKLFQDVLRTERHSYNLEVASDPGATKLSLEGLSHILIQKLIDEGQYDKALDGIQKLAKLKGWDKSGEVNIFAGITAQDIETERKKLEIEIGTLPRTERAHSN